MITLRLPVSVPMTQADRERAHEALEIELLVLDARLAADQLNATVGEFARACEEVGL